MGTYAVFQFNIRKLNNQRNKKKCVRLFYCEELASKNHLKTLEVPLILVQLIS